ncbi:MAG: YfhO family protein [Lentisphaerae bacterium]|jgi:hypothetical protein|nr:YfhO family protein [Lentisphaerota bacterium]
MKLNQAEPVGGLAARGLWAGAALLFFALVALVVFHALWTPGAILMSSDDNIGLLENNRRALENSLFHPWQGETLWGMPGMSIIRPGFLLLKWLPAVWFMNWFHGLCLALAAWLLALYLRDQQLHPAACIFGGLTAFWVGTNLTLTYAGHIGKYGTLVFLSLAIFALGRFGRTRRAAWGVVAGAAAGAMFLEQADVALFCAVLLTPLGLWEAWRAGGGDIRGTLQKSWGAALVAVVLAGAASFSVHGAGVTESTDAQTDAERWAFITQWSQPPAESLDFIAPGWTGWRSGDEKGPYWGAMGRSEGWEQTRQGFMNFKLENVYVGALPLLLALLGLAEAFRRRRAEPLAAAVFLWAGLCVMALLLSFGKFFPLYKLVSLLPGLGSIRNPNKFIHFFQVAWGVLAAYGLELAFRAEPRLLRRWVWGSAIAGGIFLLAGFAFWSNLSGGGARLAAAGWGELGRVIQRNKAFAITYAGGMFLAGAGVLWGIARTVFHGVDPARAGPWRGSRACGTTAWKKSLWVWLPALVVLFDAVFILAPHYIQTMPPGFVAENDLVKYLKRDLGDGRTAMATQDGYHGLWLTYLFPYHGIPSVNVTQLPRPPADYSAFWEAVRDPLRTWQLTGVSHVLAPEAVARQMLAHPDYAPRLEPAYAWHPQPARDGGVAVRRVPLTPDASDVVLKLKPAPPRVAAAASWRELSDAEALAELASPAFEPGQFVLLAPGSKMPPPVDAGQTPPVVNVRNIMFGRYDFTVQNSGPVVVRVAEKYDPNWRATVNGTEQPILRVDYMFQGLALAEAGTHEIVLSYAPSSLPVWLQGAGLLAGAGALLWALVPRRRAGEAAA